MAPGFDLRPARPDDEPFLFRLYAATREPEFPGWSSSELESLLGMQHRARKASHAARYPSATDHIVERDGIPVGRLHVDRSGEALVLVDVALLPEARGQGIGGRILRDLLAEAGQAGRPVRLHVEQGNPARRFYARSGFREKENRGPYVLMEWSPP
jgi:ribosomal protein S18 acetylase RimI-like enzyme